LEIHDRLSNRTDVRGRFYNFVNAFRTLDANDDYSAAFVSECRNVLCQFPLLMVFIKLVRRELEINLIGFVRAD